MTNDYRYSGLELDAFEQALNWKRYIARQLEPYLRGPVAEVGAGKGAITQALCPLAGPDPEWHCYEPDASLAAQIGNRIESGILPASVRVIVGTSIAMPVQPYFRTIIYIDVLEHIDEDREELQRVSTALLPGGHLIVLSPAYPLLFSEFDTQLGHFRRYTRKSLRATAPDNCRLVMMRNLDSCGVALLAVNRFVLRRSTPSTTTVKSWDRAVVPVSVIVDRLLAHRLGKSLVAVWRRDDA